MDRLSKLAGELRSELEKDILPFWINRMQDGLGGFYGRMDGSGRLIPDAPRGGILASRLLWTFSSAYRMFGDPAVGEAARLAYIQLRDRFIDLEFGGIYWSISPDGSPLETKKQRLSQLQQLIETYTMQYSREMHGTVQEVLVEGI